MSFIGDVLKEAIQKAMNEIEEQANTMRYAPVGDMMRSIDPYARYVEYGHPWCEDCKSFHAESMHTANVVEGSAIVLDDEEQPAQQKALPAPQQGGEGK